MCRKLIYLLAFALLLGSCGQKENHDIISLVDPMIGTDATGNTFPGPSMPFGMVQLSPDTYNTGCCSGYHYSHNRILGFSHTHLSGTGCADFGDILLLPFTGTTIPKGSAFSHDREQASPGYYSVLLDDFQILAELTVTNRVGLHRYSFPPEGNKQILVDLEHDISGDGDIPFDDCYIRVVSDTEIEGYRHSQGWAPNQHLFFVAHFSEPFTKASLLLNDEEFNGKNSITGQSVKAVLTFNPNHDKPVMVKVALSAVSPDGARKNLESELPGWDFEGTVNDAEKAWGRMLEKINIEDKDSDRKKIFYTALYHTLLTPNLYSDVDGSYRGMDKQIHPGEGFDYYHVFSLWDTYRAVHPLFNLICPDRNLDFIRTMLKQYDQSGLLPVWELAACENNCMIGYHAVPVMADAWLNGNQGFDEKKTLEAMVTSGTQSMEGIASYRKHQFIPRDHSPNSVSKVLEYAYDDWCIAQMARSMGNDSIYQEYILRSQYWRNHFDPETKLMRPRYADGRWHAPFNPFQVTMLDQGDYTEANAWHYSFYVPHDVQGLIDLHGGDEPFISMLDSFFTVKTANRHAISDFEGIFGQYAHGNEPSHHIPYLYNYAGAPWKTQEILQRAMSEFYTTAPDGLCGNDDCGQLSAWYVFSSMGFYPVCPGSGQYAIGIPVFENITINLPENKELVIKASGAGLKTQESTIKYQYIKSLRFNEQDYPYAYLNHIDLMKGGNLEFVLASEPSDHWGIESGFRPFTQPIEPENQLEPLGEGQLFMPYIKHTNVYFRRSHLVEMGCISPGAKIHYTLNGTEPRITSPQYREPFEISRTSRIRAKAFQEGYQESETMAVNFYSSSLDPASPMVRLHYLDPPFGIDYTGEPTDGKYAPQYSAGGDKALWDGKTGSFDYTDGRWQGFEGKDMEVLINLGREMPVWRITAGFLQSMAVWIFHPVEVSYYLSMDGKEFRQMEVIDNYPDRGTMTDGVRYFSSLVMGVPARYVKVRAKSVGICPPWHHGAGKKAWLFADEVIVE